MGGHPYTPRLAHSSITRVSRASEIYPSRVDHELLSELGLRAYFLPPILECELIDFARTNKFPRRDMSWGQGLEDPLGIKYTRPNAGTVDVSNDW